MVESVFSGTPEWYGGAKGALKDYIERAEAQSKEKYQPYEKAGKPLPRISPFTPLQQKGFKLVEQEATNPLYNDLYGKAAQNIGKAAGTQVAPEIQSYLQQGMKPVEPYRDIQNYMNPFQQQVMDQIESRGLRNLQENLLPSVQNQFISAGQYGSTGHQTFANRALRDTAQAIAEAQGKVGLEGYNTALNTALQARTGERERSLNAGQLAASAMGRDVERQMAAGEALQGLAGAQQQAGLRGAAAVGQMGAQQQQQGQNELNTAYQQFQEERAFPFQQMARYGEQLRGLPVQSQVYHGGFTPQTPQASPWSQGAGLVMGFGGLMNQNNQNRGYAHGGHVKKITSHYRHYADGGSLNPIQQGANHAIETAELQNLREKASQFERPQVNPFWAAVSRAGFNLAANRQPGALANLGQAAGEGLSEYHNQLDRQDSRNLQSAKIMEMIDNTKRLQAERNRAHQLEQEKFGQHQKEFGMQHGLQREQLDLARDKLKQEKVLYETGLKGLKGRQEYSPYKKSNELAIEEARKSLSTLPSLKSNLKELRKLAEKLDTGPTKGRIARTNSTLGSWIGVGSAKDIDEFDSLTNALVLDLGNQLKGSQIALGKLKMIEQSKPQLSRVKGGNLEIIDHMKELADLSEEKALFLSKVLTNGLNALDAEDAFNKYADSKLESEESGKKFTYKPEDFLEGMQVEGEESFKGRMPSEIDIKSMSDEELQRIAEGK